MWPSAAAVDALARLDEALPATRQDDAAVLALLDEIASPATVATSGGRYFGFVIGSSLPATLAANWLAGAWDQNAGVVDPIAGRGAARRGRDALDARSCSGCRAAAERGFVTCATMANFVGARGCAARAPRAQGLGRREARPVRRAADHRRRRRGSARQRAQSAWPARARTRSRGAGAGRRSGTHARRCAAARSTITPSSASRPAT